MYQLNWKKKLEMLALDLFFIHRLFWKSVSDTSYSGFVPLFCFGFLWLIPAEWGRRLLVRLGTVPFSILRRGLPPVQPLRLCSVSSRSKMISISTDLYSLQLKSDLYSYDFLILPPFAVLSRHLLEKALMHLVFL